MVGLVTIGYGYAGKAFQEPFGMLGAPCGLVIVEYGGTRHVAFTAPVYPHVAVGSGRAAVTDDLKRPREGAVQGEIFRKEKAYRGHECCQEHW